jgi:hypothetical protein
VAAEERREDFKGKIFVQFCHKTGRDLFGVSPDHSPDDFFSCFGRVKSLSCGDNIINSGFPCSAALRTRSVTPRTINKRANCFLIKV